MSYAHFEIPYPPETVFPPVLLQAPPPYEGTATYGGQMAPLYYPPGR